MDEKKLKKAEPQDERGQTSEVGEWVTAIVIGFLAGPFLFTFLKFVNEPYLKWLEFLLVALFYRFYIRRKTVRISKEVKEWIEVFVFAGFLVLNIRAFVVQAYKIPSGSMIPTLEIKDRLFVSRFNYWKKLPKRNEIVIFIYPQDKKKDFIKRVIAVEGDTVRIIDKQVYVNGAALNEPYKIHNDSGVYPFAPQNPRDNLGVFQVPKDHLFVMGDNRDQSLDSRYWGFVPHKNLKGKALFIYWPFNRWRIIK